MSALNNYPTTNYGEKNKDVHCTVYKQRENVNVLFWKTILLLLYKLLIASNVCRYHTHHHLYSSEKLIMIKGYVWKRRTVLDIISSHKIMQTVVISVLLKRIHLSRCVRTLALRIFTVNILTVE